MSGKVEYVPGAPWPTQWEDSYISPFPWILWVRGIELVTPEDSGYTWPTCFLPRFGPCGRTGLTWQLRSPAGVSAGHWCQSSFPESRTERIKAGHQSSSSPSINDYTMLIITFAAIKRKKWPYQPQKFRKPWLEYQAQCMANIMCSNIYWTRETWHTHQLLILFTSKRPPGPAHSGLVFTKWKSDLRERVEWVTQFATWKRFCLCLEVSLVLLWSLCFPTSYLTGIL